MESFGATYRRLLGKPPAELGIGWWERSQAVAKSPQVQRCAADEENAPATRPAVGDRPRGVCEPLRDAVGLRRRDHVHNVVRHRGPLGGGRLRGAHVEPPVDGHRIDAHDLGTKATGQWNRERRFARGGRPRQEPAVIPEAWGGVAGFGRVAC